MLWQRVESEGLAHYSYLVGRDGEALVVDPRLDVDVYEDLLARSSHRLRYILETHRHEDFLVGSHGGSLVKFLRAQRLRPGAKGAR